jgi:hypothetical protein
MTTINGAVLGDHLKIADATAFDATEITAAQVLAAGGGTSSLAGWVEGALSAAGDNLAQHSAAWFVFDHNTYIVEQSASEGATFGAGDTIVRLAGSLNLSSGSYSAGSASIIL